MEKKNISRRKLIKQSATVALGSSLYFSTPFSSFASPKEAGKTSGKSKVILIRNKNVVDDNGIVNKNIISDMLDEAVIDLTGATSKNEAWNKILKPDDTLGIKTNVWSHLHTPHELEDALKERALETGIQEKKISTSDRGILRDDNFKNATALINVRPLRTHHWSGVGTLIKNYIMFVERPSAYHGDSCADLAKIWKDQGLDKKTRLNILVMLTPLFHGVGPHHYNRNYIWTYGGLLVGFDPVAVDATGVRILQEKRKEFFGEERPINPPPKHIYLAETRHHLGVANPENIELVRKGWEEGILI